MSLQSILIIAVLFFILAPILSGEGQALGSNHDHDTETPKEDD